MVCCNPPLGPKLVCFNCLFQTNNTDVDQKTYHKIRKKNKDKKKGVESENKTEKQKTERIDEKYFQI